MKMMLPVHTTVYTVITPDEPWYLFLLLQPLHSLSSDRQQQQQPLSPKMVTLTPSEVRAVGLSDRSGATMKGDPDGSGGCDGGTFPMESYSIAFYYLMDASRSGASGIEWVTNAP